MCGPHRLRNESGSAKKKPLMVHRSTIDPEKGGFRLWMILDNEWYYRWLQEIKAKFSIIGTLSTSLDAAYEQIKSIKKNSDVVHMWCQGRREQVTWESFRDIAI